MKIIIYFFCGLFALNQGISETVAIIGGGPAGIVSAKSAIEAGLKPTVFEKSDGIGGVWNQDHGATWDGMRTNISRYTCMFSDYAWKSSIGIFPYAKDVYGYLQSYITNFGVTPHIRLNTEVISVSYNEEDQKWNVVSKRGEEVAEQGYDNVIVASGFFSAPLMPSIDLTPFEGEILHSQDYKSSEAFRGKKVVVVGGAFSGAEIAAEVSKVTDKVTHVLTRKFWVLPRYLTDGSLGKKLPLDMIFYKRSAPSTLSVEEQNRATHQYFSQISRQGEICDKLAISEEEYSSHPFVVISDIYLDQIELGRVAICNNRVSGMSSSGVLLEEGEELEADVVIFCTGFATKLPYFGEDILDEIEFSPSDQFQPLLLHERMFHPKLPNMAFVGMYRGPYFGVMELQARWACLAFKDKEQFYPSVGEMKEGIERERAIRNLDPRPQFPHGDYIGLTDAIAKKIGVFPGDHVLPDVAVITPLYRLKGPGSNPVEALTIFMEYEKFLLGEP